MKLTKKKFGIVITSATGEPVNVRLAQDEASATRKAFRFNTLQKAIGGTDVATVTEVNATFVWVKPKVVKTTEDNLTA